MAFYNKLYFSIAGIAGVPLHWLHESSVFILILFHKELKEIINGDDDYKYLTSAMLPALIAKSQCIIEIYTDTVIKSSKQEFSK